MLKIEIIKDQIMITEIVGKIMKKLSSLLSSLTILERYRSLKMEKRILTRWGLLTR